MLLFSTPHVTPYLLTELLHYPVSSFLLAIDTATAQRSGETKYKKKREKAQGGIESGSGLTRAGV
jgi:hypothetical protein